jgi:hypothetical protein
MDIAGFRIARRRVMLAGAAWILAAAFGHTWAQRAGEAGTPDAAALSRPPAICAAPWLKAGAQAQMEAEGETPMSITITVRQPSMTPHGCIAWVDIHSKSALAATMGPPVIMDQVHKLIFERTPDSPDGAVTSQRATINAQARYARLFGEASFQGKGLLNYAGIPLREGATLPGETLESSATLVIHSLATDEPVATIRAPRASVTIGPRHVGHRQVIETALGRRECLPITYEKRASLGPLFLGDDLEQPEPTTMSVTDWYCPSEAFVLRTEIRQQGKTEKIETTALGLPE